MSINNDLDFTTLNTGGAPQVPVKIYWNNNDIAAITGPCPFVSMGTTFTRNDNSVVDTVSRTITLTGKILRAPDPSESDPSNNRSLTPDGRGIQALMGARSDLENIFTSCDTGKISIQCSTAGSSANLYEADKVRVNNINFDQTDNNWANTIDYSIELEVLSSPSGSVDKNVTEKSDSWTIEPLDDIVYTRFITSVIARNEWSNPFRSPPASAGGAGSSENLQLQIINIPQFKITRRLSAKGIGDADTAQKDKCAIPIPSSPGNTPQPTPTPTSSGLPGHMYAKAWVDKMTLMAFDKTARTGEYSNIPFFTDQPLISDFQSTFLYNHTRVVNLDASNASYEATDTWLAMPTGMPYSETYTVETSTSLEYIKTVTVAGNVQGLAFTPMNIQDGTTGVFPTGSGSPLRIGLDWSLTLPTEGDLPSPYDIDQPGARGKVTTLTNSKYLNAASGWIYDIKPYLYRRACLAVNQGGDRVTPYVNPAKQTPPQPPQNPIYSKETLLSVIPISTTEGHDPKKGTISYNYQYNNKFNIISGTISENIVITDDLPVQQISEITVPGRQLGPILDTAGTTAARKTVNIEVTVMPPTGINECFMQQAGCPLFTGGYIYSTINKLVEGIRPFGYADPGVFGVWKKNQQGQAYTTTDQDTWSPTQGRYSRTVTWTYQQCSNARSTLDH